MQITGPSDHGEAMDLYRSMVRRREAGASSLTDSAGCQSVLLINHSQPDSLTNYYTHGVCIHLLRNFASTVDGT